MSNIKMYKYEWYWKKNIPSGFQLASIQPQRCIENVMVFYDIQPTYNKQMRDTVINYRNVINGNAVKDRIKNEHNLGTKPKRIERRNTKDLKVTPVNFLDINCVPRRTGHIHPTQKPVALCEYLILTYTNEGDTVLDFCMGSGTTGVACVKTNRNFIGIEKEHDYFEIAERRIDEAQQQMVMAL
jgi:site-specific DNA-methyltransferase (adenine-specific)